MDVLNNYSEDIQYYKFFIYTHTNDLDLKLLIKNYNYSLNDLRIISENLCLPKNVIFTHIKDSTSQLKLLL